MHKRFIFPVQHRKKETHTHTSSAINWLQFRCLQILLFCCFAVWFGRLAFPYFVIELQPAKQHHCHKCILIQSGDKGECCAFFVFKVIRSTDAMPYKRHFSLGRLLLEKRENFRYMRRIFMKTALPSIRLSFVFVKCKQLNYSINLFISLTLTLAFFHTNTLNIEIESDSN